MEALYPKAYVPNTTSIDFTVAETAVPAKALAFIMAICSGMVTLMELIFEKALLSIDEMLSGILMLVRDVEWKAFSPIVKSPSCSLHVFKPESEKADEPIVATLEGMSISFS